MGIRWMHTGILLLLLQVTVWSQQEVKIRKSEFKTSVEAGFKEAWKSVKQGNAYFKEGIGTYDLARDHYLFANLYNNENPQLNYRIGACYLFTDDKYEAIDYFQKAYFLDPEVSPDIHLLLAKAYHLVLEFDDAMEHYQAYSDQLEQDERNEFADDLAKYLAECQNGKELSQSPARVIVQNLGEGVNSRYDDYNPIFADRDTALFFTSRRPDGKNPKRNPLDNKFDEDIYRAPNGTEGFETAVRLDKPYNTSHNDALVSVSPEGNRFYIYRGNVDGGTIEVSSYRADKQKWTSPRGIPGKLTSKDGESSACLSPDGTEFYFISSNRDLTIGGKDIMISRLDRKGKWGEPQNLSAEINSAYDEEGIFITPDGKFLYFASQGHNSMGGFDIFRSERMENGVWSRPVNLGYPINTPDDESFYITDTSGVFGYYSAIREGGIGAKDIYKVIYLGSEKELVTRTVDELVAGPGPVKTGFLTRPQRIELDTSLIVTGRVLDTIDGELPVVARLSFIDTRTGEHDGDVISDTSGTYSVSLPEPKVFGVEINAPGYLYFLDIIDLTSSSSDVKQTRDFYLQKVEVGTKVVLENIYFETGKAVLRPESYDALDQVYRFLENNPTMQLEISGHTDNTGSLRINERLSRERAKAVVDYLTGRGIPEEMLVYEGYADTQPVAPNDTPEGRERNRRVEFKVLSK